MRLIFLISVIYFFSCAKEHTTEESIDAYRVTQTITYNDIDIDVVIDKPALYEMDVLLVFHGTVLYDSNLITAANTTLDKFKGILDSNDMMIISVAYPQENVLFGDSIIECEAALLWLKNNASQELGITINKIFLAGHSQGGYMVTRLNTMHQTNGVIANAPGPLNLVYRCQLEENGMVQPSVVCSNLKDLIEQKKLEVVDSETISEISTFEAKGSSYEASGNNHDDLVMNLVMFSWFISSDAFSDILDMDLKGILYQDRIKEIEDDLIPFGFIDSGTKSYETERYDNLVQQQKDWLNF